MVVDVLADFVVGELVVVAGVGKHCSCDFGFGGADNCGG